MKKLALALPLAAVSLFGAALAHAQTVVDQTPTVIDHLPYVIQSSGLYVLNRNLSTSETNTSLIQINASNVTLDFQGHFISGPTGNTNQQNFGVFANERSNLTIKNGTVAYCRWGIYLRGNGGDATNSVDQEIDHMRVTYCYSAGITMYQALASTVTNCKVSQFGYSSATETTYGIQVVGAGTTVQDCAVSQGLGNPSIGIAADYGSFVRRNTVSSCKYGCAGGKYQDNLSFFCTNPFSFGLDAGGNN